MLSRRLLALLLLAAPVAVSAQEQTPQQFLQSIYEPYKKADFKGQPYWEAGRFFAPDLARAIDKDFAEAKKRKEVPTLDGDPFVDAQEWDISDFDIAVTDTAPASARATVKFVNLGKETTAVLDLVKIKNEWRVGDITWLRDGKSATLRGIYVHQ